MSQDWDARDYAENSSAQAEWARELLAKLPLKGEESVLDIGCGDGKISAEIAERLPVGRVVGIDLSEDMIRLARERFPAGRHANLDFLQMDAAAISLERRFDIAFSNAVLHWVSDQPAVLRGVRGCLVPGGRLLFQMGGRGNAADVQHCFDELAASRRWRRYFPGFQAPYRFYAPEEYELWLAQAGFQPQRLQPLEKDMRHPGPERLLGWMRTTWFPYTARLPAPLREGFLGEALQRYLSRVPPDCSGQTHVRMVRLEVEARAV